MNALSKNCLFQNRLVYLGLLLYVFVGYTNRQIVNYIINPSFEVLITNTTTPNFPGAKFWGATDSSKFYGEPLSKNTTPPKVPLCGFTYQWPHSGDNHLIAKFYCTTCPGNIRGYPRNRLKQVLKANTSYCFSMYVNLSNQSTYGIDAI